MKSISLIILLLSVSIFAAETVSISASKTDITANGIDSSAISITITDTNGNYLSLPYTISQTSNSFGTFDANYTGTTDTATGETTVYFHSRSLTGSETIGVTVQISSDTSVYNYLTVNLIPRVPDTIILSLEPKTPLFSKDTTVLTIAAYDVNKSLVTYNTATISVFNSTHIDILDTTISTGSTGICSTVLTLYDTGEKTIIKIQIGNYITYDTLWVWQDPNRKKDRTSPKLMSFYELSAGDFNDYEYINNKPSFYFSIIDTPVGMELSTLKIYIDDVLQSNTDTDIVVTVYDTETGVTVNPDIYRDYPDSIIIAITRTEQYSNGLHKIHLSLSDHAGNAPLTFTRYFNTNENLTLSNVLNCPNPFNPEREYTYFTYTLSIIPTETKIKIFDINGNLLTTLTGTNKMGYNTVLWNGIVNNRMLNNGLYFYRINTKSSNGNVVKSNVEKVVILR